MLELEEQTVDAFLPDKLISLDFCSEMLNAAALTVRTDIEALCRIEDSPPDLKVLTDVEVLCGIEHGPAAPPASESETLSTAAPDARIPGAQALGAQTLDAGPAEEEEDDLAWLDDFYELRFTMTESEEILRAAGTAAAKAAVVTMMCYPLVCIAGLL